MLRPIGLLAPLVEYPDSTLAAAAERCVKGLSSDPEMAASVAAFAEAALSLGLAALEESYVEAFELRAESSLYVGHHLFGEDARRNVLLTRLKSRCLERAIECEHELPDHLGIMLRLVAVEPPGEETDELLEDCLIPVVKRISQLLAAGKSSPYNPLMRALVGALERQLLRERARCPSFSTSSCPT